MTDIEVGAKPGTAPDSSARIRSASAAYLPSTWSTRRMFSHSRPDPTASSRSAPRMPLVATCRQAEWSAGSVPMV